MKKGFTLIEVLVSVSIFTIVMLISTGSVFTIVAANKKTHSLKSVMTNLDFALESMARDMRVGTKYVCNNDDASKDCQSGGTVLRYKANRDVDGDGFYAVGDSNDQIEYSLAGGRLMKRIYSNGRGAFPITAAEINITNLTFYLTGARPGDGRQPKVVITVRGNAGTPDVQSNFNIETMVTQRAIDS